MLLLAGMLPFVTSLVLFAFFDLMGELGKLGVASGQLALSGR